MLTNKEATVELNNLKKIIRGDLMWGGRGSSVVNEERTSRLLEAIEMGENSLNMVDAFIIIPTPSEEDIKIIKNLLQINRPITILETSKHSEYYGGGYYYEY